MPVPNLGPLRMTLIVAASMQNGIGASGSLPWRLAKDMAYFRKATTHLVDIPEDDARMADAGYERRKDVRIKNAVIMGRNTWESIPERFRPLSDRLNVVVSTTQGPEDLGIDTADPDTVVVKTFDDAVTFLQERRIARYLSTNHADQSALGRTFVIGGAAIYRYVMTHSSEHWTLDNMLVTRIFSPMDFAKQCDVFMQEFRSPTQQAWENELGQKCSAVASVESMPSMNSTEDAASWKQAPKAEHSAFFADAPLARDACELLQDKESVIQFQLWRRNQKS
ncbi:dihydrofolate reductase [Malassezia psittaci]|uniref:Dihydrofolate reductase n=1 Tax=Malassezia psittaci TaxID=1821823 RepID=A0AAF0FCS0_9BASI|nr:dihydrofolate reductase [Malassezia psittaci]